MRKAASSALVKPSAEFRTIYPHNCRIAIATLSPFKKKKLFLIIPNCFLSPAGQASEPCPSRAGENPEAPRGRSYPSCDSTLTLP